MKKAESLLKKIFKLWIVLSVLLSAASCKNNTEETPLPRQAETDLVKIEGLSDGYLVSLKTIRHGGGEIEIEGCPILTEIRDNKTSYHIPFGQNGKNAKFFVRFDYDTDGKDHWGRTEEELVCAADGGYEWQDLIDPAAFEGATVSGSFDQDSNYFKGKLSPASGKSLTEASLIKDSNIVIDTVLKVQPVLGFKEWNLPISYNRGYELRTEYFGEGKIISLSEDSDAFANIQTTDANLNVRYDWQGDQLIENPEIPDYWQWMDCGLSYCFIGELRFKILGYDTEGFPGFKLREVWSDQYQLEDDSSFHRHMTLVKNDKGINVTITGNYYQANGAGNPDASIRVSGSPIVMHFNSEAPNNSESKDYIFTKNGQKYLVIADIRVPNEEGDGDNWTREAGFCTAGGGTPIEDCVNFDIEGFYNDTRVRSEYDSTNDFTIWMEGDFPEDEELIKNKTIVPDIEVQLDANIGDPFAPFEEQVRLDCWGSIGRRSSDFDDKEDASIIKWFNSKQKPDKRDGFNFDWAEYNNKYYGSAKIRLVTADLEQDDWTYFEFEDLIGDVNTK